VNVNIDPTERLNLTLTAGAVAASFVLLTPGFALSLGLGGLLETVNFRGLRRSAQAMFFPTGGGIASIGSTGFGLRFALLAFALGVALYAGAHPVGLLLGLSLIMPASIVEAWRNRPAIDPNAPALSSDHEDWERWNPWLAREIEPSDEEESLR